MTDVVSMCRTTWKRLGVPSGARADLESELRADLEAAAADGVDATTFVGGDAAGFAREWSVARGLVRARWRVVGSVVASATVGFASLAIADDLLRLPWLHPLFDPGQGEGQFWLNVYAGAAPFFVLPVLGSVGLYLWIVRDPLVVSTALVVLIASPGIIWASAVAAWWLDGDGGETTRLLWFTVLFALLVGALRAVVVAASRRAGAPAL
jgi:hypothetical protein